NPKPETRNPNPETRNPKPEIRNTKTETRNPKSEIRKPRPESRNPKPESGGAGSVPPDEDHHSHAAVPPKPSTSNSQPQPRRRNSRSGFLALSHSVWPTILKLACWVCGANPSTLGRRRARARQISEPKQTKTELRRGRQQGFPLRPV
ncbi:hypothetical protein T484DRAFT_1628968, partial [Baffinella frigidus]